MNIIDLIFPKACLACRRSGYYLCNQCVRKVGFSQSICPMCNENSIDGYTHETCKKPYGLDGLTSIWHYKGVIKKGVRTLKYSFAYDISNELIDTLCKVLSKADKPVPKTGIFVPIPLHKKRENWRGFNQTAVLGKRLAYKLKYSFKHDILVQNKEKVPQATLHKDEREKNIRGVFSLNPLYREIVNGQTIILFDDVWTTGTTMREAGKVLKRNGAKAVWGMTVAH